MFTDRIENLKSEVLSRDLPADVADLVLRVLEITQNADSGLEKSPIDVNGTTFPTFVDESLGRLRGPLAATDADALLAWSKAHAQGLTGELAGIATKHGATGKSAVGYMASEGASLTQRISALSDTRAIRAAADAALTTATDAAERAQDAAGTAGEASLAGHFSAYAKSERRASEWFRGLSIAGILAAIVMALLVPHADANDWTGLVYRIAILAGVGALSAYFARQAGHHRRNYNWAKGLEVQLMSFSAFISPAPDEVLGDIYREFARRVLGAPPEGLKSSGADESLPVAQLVDAVTTLAKRPA